MTVSLYEKDFQSWLETTIYQLKNRDFEKIDIENLVEELSDLGKSDKAALESNLMILLAHLLKLHVQHDAPESMKNSWYNSIIEHRKRINKQLKVTPSLKSYLPKILDDAYVDGRDIAIKEAQKASFGVRIPAMTEYPLNCPFTIEQILNDDFYSLKEDF